MGLDRLFIEGLMREHLHRPISGNVVLIGRQTIFLSPDELLELLAANGLRTPGMKTTDIALDDDTKLRPPSYRGRSLVVDREVFRLLGVPSVHALDHSPYEGADIIHDLNKLIPRELQESVDFIVDGSTVDNCWNPSLTLQNYVAMLRPGGRMLMTNMYSNYNEPYSILPPLWYFDYLCVNGFSDVKCYVTVYSNAKPPQNYVHVFALNLANLLDDSRTVLNFVSDYVMGCIVFAEKGSASSSDRYPIQQHYRGPEQWSEYKRNLRVIMASPRPHILRSGGPNIIGGVRDGHLFIDPHFNAIEPTVSASTFRGKFQAVRRNVGRLRRRA